MRYLLLVVSLLLVLVSCSTQTESNTDQEVSLIVGTWKPVKEVDVCTTGSEQVYQYDACQQEGQYERICLDLYEHTVNDGCHSSQNVLIRHLYRQHKGSGCIAVHGNIQLRLVRKEFQLRLV